MTRRSSRIDPGPGRPGREISAPVLLLLHGACYLLVLFYVNMFAFWAWLSRSLGPGFLVKLLPVAVTAVVLLVIALRFVDRVNRGYSIKPVFLGLGLVCAIFSLALPEPAIPIKRIHVAEYIVLSFLVRATLSHRLQGAQLTLFTVLVTLLLGIHDEMLQGLHPQRYYGWRDIIVNGTAGLSGALLGHGLLCCVRPAVATARSRIQGLAGPVLLLFLVGASLVWLVMGLYQQRGSAFSLLLLLPQVGSCLLLMTLRPDIVFSSRTQHGLQAVFWLAFSLAAYPLAARLATMEFV
ncbi:MAG: VanZ family protein [Desulfobulbaceae bacterium]